MIPRSEWTAQWSLKYARKCSEISVKNSEQHFLPLHVATLWQELPVDTFSDVFEREASSVEGKSLQQKDTKRRKREGQKNNNNKNEKPKDVGQFLTCPSKSFVKRDAGGKKGELSCCKCLLSRLELIWPISSLKSPKYPKYAFLAKSSGVNGLVYFPPCRRGWNVHVAGFWKVYVYFL